MFFNKPKPTVTPEDQEWVEDAFIWFESQYGREYLKNLTIIEPTQSFFPRKFTGIEEDAYFLLEQCMTYMDIKDAEVDLYFFSDAPILFDSEEMRAEIDSTDNLSTHTEGLYRESDAGKFEIGLERNMLRNPGRMIAAIAHELSHLILLGERRIDENDEFLTDLNCIALGFGIFTSNHLFSYDQWQGVNKQGWEMKSLGYLPLQVAAYALALFNHYQSNTSDWHRHLNPDVKKQYDKNLNFINSQYYQPRFK